MAMTRKIPATKVVLSDDSAWLPLDDIFSFLSQEMFWTRDLSRDTSDQSVTNSFCFVAYRLDGDGPHGELVGSVRVITDRATFAHLCDMFVLPVLHGEDISHALMDFLREHPDLQTLCHTVLATTGVDWLYRKHDFADMLEGIGFMQSHRPNIYTTASA